MNRRGFIRGFLGLLGLGTVAKAASVVEEKARPLGRIRSLCPVMDEMIKPLDAFGCVLIKRYEMRLDEKYRQVSHLHVTVLSPPEKVDKDWWHEVRVKTMKSRTVVICDHHRTWKMRIKPKQIFFNQELRYGTYMAEAVEIV